MLRLESYNLQRGTENNFQVRRMGDNANVISGEHGPSISNVTSLNDGDFESMMETPDEDTADSKDVVFMRYVRRKPADAGGNV